MARISNGTRLALAALMMRTILCACLGAAAWSGCGIDTLGNEGFEIDCDGAPCDWKVVEGNVSFGSWHPGDTGADLSGEGRAVIEQRSAPFVLPGRELVLSAAAVRESASLRIEIDWYVTGAGSGPTYWDRDPLLIDTRAFDVTDNGVFAIEQLVSTPSLEVTGLALRVVKDGQGIAMVDEISLTEPEVLP